MTDRERTARLNADNALDDPGALVALREQMLKWAVLHLGEREAAEDAVQEAFVGALRNRASFTHAAAFRTWVFAILRNKIADVLRARIRQRDREVTGAADPDEEMDVERFDERGTWREAHRPSRWSDPAGMTEDAQFWRVFETCLEHLSGRTARVFMMREFVELDIADICDTLQITRNAVSVTLFRARAQLRECLESRWFKEK